MREHSSAAVPIFDAVLPAGGRIAGSFAQEAGAEIKALISLHGLTLLERTIDALRATGRIARIVVIGPDELKNHAATRAADVVLSEAESGPANIFRGLQWLHEQSASQPDGTQLNGAQLNGLQEAHRVLVVTTDLPFLTPAAINGFLEACPATAEVCVPIIRREAFEARFPDCGGDYVRLRDGEWTMGCAFLLNSVALTRNRLHIERIFEARKSQLAMARLLGPLFIARFLCGRLQVAHIQARCESVLGCTGHAVLGCAPELAFDIDQPEEFRLAVAHGSQETARQ